MKYMVDIDGTICHTDNSDYPNSKPYMGRIAHFNMLYDMGYEICYWTARGSKSNKDWYEFTLNQLKEWGVKFTSFSVGKPMYDIWIDDKSVNFSHYFRNMDYEDSVNWI